MRSRRIAVIVMTATAFALSAQTGDAPTNMPPNTIKLSDMVRELSGRPGFTDALLKEIQRSGKKSGTALLTPDLIDHLRQLITLKDWEMLDRFPAWPMFEI